MNFIIKIAIVISLSISAMYIYYRHKLHAHMSYIKTIDNFAEFSHGFNIYLKNIESKCKQDGESTAESFVFIDLLSQMELVIPNGKIRRQRYWEPLIASKYCKYAQKIPRGNEIIPLVWEVPTKYTDKILVLFSNGTGEIVNANDCKYP